MMSMIPRLAPRVNARDYALGATHATITLVEYGDYGSDASVRAHAIVKAVRRFFGKELRFVFRSLPLRSASPHAETAARAAHAAGSVGMFWEMHELLLANPNAHAPSDIAAYVEALGIDASQVFSANALGRYAARVQEDALAAIACGVHETPVFFIGDERYDGPLEVESLVHALARSIRRARGVARSRSGLRKL
jgi:protein-disulfide isomerase